MIASEATLVFGDAVGRFEVLDESFVDDFFQNLANSVY